MPRFTSQAPAPSSTTPVSNGANPHVPGRNPANQRREKQREHDRGDRGYAERDAEQHRALSAALYALAQLDLGEAHLVATSRLESSVSRWMRSGIPTSGSTGIGCTAMIPRDGMADGARGGKERSGDFGHATRTRRWSPQFARIQTWNP